MVAVDKISWGKYGGYEGPYFPGSIPYALLDGATEGEKRLRVVTSTEGGSYDAINMYDKCIVSVGLIQWCEGIYFLTSRMLHHVVQETNAKVVLDALDPALDFCGAEFKPNANKQWRFFFKDDRGEVNTPAKQQQLFLGCDGKEGSWTPAAKVRAKLWASCFSEIWKDQAARRAQASYTAKRLTTFVSKEATKILFDGTSDEGMPGALRAAYLSFAANNTVRASDQLLLAVAKLKSKKWSSDWCIGVLQQLTFGPDIKIYPKRYEDIRPVLEGLWMVTLPKTAADLKAWVEPMAPVVVPPVHVPTPVLVPAVVAEPVIVPSAPVPDPVIVVEEPKETDDEVVARFKAPGLLQLILDILARVFGKK